VDINFITSDSTLLLRARSGAADVTLGLSSQSVASLKSDSAVRIVDSHAAQWQMVSLPNKLVPFNNAKLREALSYAVPYQQILSKVAYGYGQLYFGPYPPAFQGYDAAIETPRTEDLAKAKQLLAESGVKTPVKLRLYIRNGETDQQQIATVIQGAWQALGINVSIQQLTAAAYQNAETAPLKSYSIVRDDGPSVTNPEWLLEYDNTCASANADNYCDPQADKLLAAAEATTNASAIQKDWNEIASLWIQDVPRIPLYAIDYTAVLKSSITHYSFSQNNLFFNEWG
jgi:peptide/nickel transport system substrate-binding protein